MIDYEMGDILVRKIKTLIKNEVDMNYYFTGGIIILLVLLTLIAAPISY